MLMRPNKATIAWQKAGLAGDMKVKQASRLPSAGLALRERIQSNQQTSGRFLEWYGFRTTFLSTAFTGRQWRWRGTRYPGLRAEVVG